MKEEIAELSKVLVNIQSKWQKTQNEIDDVAVGVADIDEASTLLRLVIRHHHEILNKKILPELRESNEYKQETIAMYRRACNLIGIHPRKIEYLLTRLENPRVNPAPITLIEDIIEALTIELNRRIQKVIRAIEEIPQDQVPGTTQPGDI